MLARIVILIILTVILFGCNSSVDLQKPDLQIIESLVGEWEIINESRTSEFPQHYGFYTQGMTFTNDSIEFYSGILEIEIDRISGDRQIVSLGNFAPYRIDKDSIFIKDPSTGKWRFKWRFVCRSNDTLQLAVNDSVIAKFKRICYNLDTLPEYDQIVYSTSGCYGSCDIMDVSINKNGEVLFFGSNFVKPLGFFIGNLDSNTKRSIFEKIRLANPSRLQETDNEVVIDATNITTTYIRKGKIVKTILYHDLNVPNQVLWANAPVSLIHTTVELESLPIDDPFYNKVYTVSFEKEGAVLELEKSEGFFLWTELTKSKVTIEHFIPKYRLNIYGIDFQKRRYRNKKIEKVTTDGRFYKFEFKEDDPITYDLGYDFIERNFKVTDFEKSDR